MSFTHADYARALKETRRPLADKLAWEARTGKIHPRVKAETLAALDSCAKFHEQAAREQRQAEARMQDLAAGGDS